MTRFRAPGPLLVVLLPVTLVAEPSGLVNLPHYSKTVWFGLAILADADARLRAVDAAAADALPHFEHFVHHRLPWG